MSSARLHINIERRLANFKLSVRLEAGSEILVLFGPSGAGKTQTLNAVAGILTPDCGEIVFDGVTYFRRDRDGARLNLPARQRRVGYVFQHYALFPHLTALQNVEYPLWRQRSARERALALLSKMHLEHLAGHYPHELSGGQQQRVAIARALAAESKVLLLDEPFSALDSAIRERLHEELLELQAETNMVVIYVTHNLDDALSVGHRLAIMRDGRIEQIGEVEEVLSRPNSHAVMEILGMPNVLQARVIEADAANAANDANADGLWLDWDGLRLAAPLMPVGAGELVTAYVHPEDIEVLRADSSSRSATLNQLAGRIVRKQPGRAAHSLRVKLANGHEIEASMRVSEQKGLPLEVGEAVWLILPRERLVVTGSPAEPKSK